MVLTMIILFIYFERSLIDQQALEDSWLAGMLFFVLPLGIYLLTDPERIDRSRNGKGVE